MRKQEQGLFYAPAQSRENEQIIKTIIRLTGEHLDFRDSALLPEYPLLIEEICKTFDSVMLRSNRNLHFLSTSDEYANWLIGRKYACREQIIQLESRTTEALERALEDYHFNMIIAIPDFTRQDSKDEDDFLVRFNKIIKSHSDRSVTMYKASMVYYHGNSRKMIKTIQQSNFMSWDTVELIDVTNGYALTTDSDHFPCAVIYADETKSSRLIHVIDRLTHSRYYSDLWDITPIGQHIFGVRDDSFYLNILETINKGQTIGRLKTYDSSLDEESKTNGSVINVRDRTGSAFYYESTFKDGVISLNGSGMAILIGKRKNPIEKATTFQDGQKGYHRLLVSPGESLNAVSYLKTKLVRMLLLITKSNQHITLEDLNSIPLVDFSHPWTDDMVYKRFKVPQSVISLIDKIIPEWY